MELPAPRPSLGAGVAAWLMEDDEEDHSPATRPRANGESTRTFASSSGTGNSVNDSAEHNDSRTTISLFDALGLDDADEYREWAIGMREWEELIMQQPQQQPPPPMHPGATARPPPHHSRRQR